jgi:DNA-binding transcriptional MerR regulator
MSDAALPLDAPEIPDKLFFRIGEVSAMLGVEAHVLRFWETEFPALSPKKAGSGHRLYRRKDVELLIQIKYLLYEKRFTIEGARQTLQSDARRPKAPAHNARQQNLFGADPLAEVRRELAAILDILK